MSGSFFISINISMLAVSLHTITNTSSCKETLSSTSYFGTFIICIVMLQAWNGTSGTLDICWTFWHPWFSVFWQNIPFTLWPILLELSKKIISSVFDPFHIANTWCTQYLFISLEKFIVQNLRIPNTLQGWWSIILLINLFLHEHHKILPSTRT